MIKRTELHGVAQSLQLAASPLLALVGPPYYVQWGGQSRLSGFRENVRKDVILNDKAKIIVAYRKSQNKQIHLNTCLLELNKYGKVRDLKIIDTWK
jgi:hypothetical protein